VFDAHLKRAILITKQKREMKTTGVMNGGQ